VVELRAHREAVAPRVLARRERERGGPIKPVCKFIRVDSANNSGNQTRDLGFPFRISSLFLPVCNVDGSLFLFLCSA
jgi:hypothetical protein